jgi:hypothetical protein
MQRCLPRPCGVRRIIPDVEYIRDWPVDAALADARRGQWPVGGWPAVLAAWRWKLHARAARLWCWCLFCACSVPVLCLFLSPGPVLFLSTQLCLTAQLTYTHTLSLPPSVYAMVLLLYPLLLRLQICFYRLQLSARWIHIHPPTVPEMNLTLVEFYHRLPGTKSTKTTTGSSSKWANLANYKVC